MESRLSKIDTLWSVVRRANSSQQPLAQAAQQKLWNQYSGAVRRYLFAALRNETAVEEVMSELALKIARNDFHMADPQKGPFRTFLKTCLFRMVADWRRKQVRNREHQASQDAPIEIESIDERQEDTEFVTSWREELLTQAWIDLEDYEEDTGRPWNTVLRAKISNADLNTEQLADIVTKKTGKPMSVSNYRVVLHRSRDKFGDFLVQQVANTLDPCTRESLEAELVELSLLEFCKQKLDSIEF